MSMRIGKTKALFTALFSVLLLLAWVPTASAQIDIGDAGGAAGDAGDAVSDAAGDASDAVDNATDSVDKAVDDATDAVDNATGNATDDATDAVDNTVDDATDTVDDTVKDATNNPTGDPVDKVKKKVDDTLDELTGGGRKDPVTRTKKIIEEAPVVLADVVETVTGVVSKRQTDKRGGSVEVRYQREGKDRVVRTYESPLAAYVLSSRVARGDGSAASSSSSTTSESTGGMWQKVLNGAGRVAQKIAFPLALALMVAAFLMVQNRMDKSDPKLALAPLDIDEQYISFE